MVLAFVLGLVVATAATAGAASLITGKQIKDGSISAKDLSKAVQKQLARPGVAGAPGPAGAKGDAGARGETGPRGETGSRGFSAWDPIPAGQTVTGSFVYDSQAVIFGDYSTEVALPALAPVALTNTTVNFSPDIYAGTTDDDAACTGSAGAPTAPPGKVCVYMDATDNDTAGAIGAAATPARTGFIIAWTDDGANADVYIRGSWAYTAP